MCFYKISAGKKIEELKIICTKKNKIKLWDITGVWTSLSSPTNLYLQNQMQVVGVWKYLLIMPNQCTKKQRHRLTYEL